MEDVNLPHIQLCSSPALRDIQQDSLNITVVKPDLGFESTLFGLSDVPCCYVLLIKKRSSQEGHFKTLLRPHDHCDV